MVSVGVYPVQKALRGIESTAQYAAGLVVSYEKSAQDARILRRQLAELAAAAADRAEVSAENERLRNMMHFQRRQPRLMLEPAEVIGKAGGTLIIDRGRLHGVHEFMCVVTGDGVVGVVAEAKPLTSYVFTLHHGHCKIAAMIERTRAPGVVRGSGSDLSYVCAMEYIDLKDDVAEGDRVVTRGDSIFPTGFPIGFVTGVEATGALQKRALVEPAANPYTVEEVFLVRKAVDPAEEFTGGPAMEEGAVKAAPAGDKRSLQERYAP